MKPGPMVELNKAIAVGFAKSPDDGLAALANIKELNEHYIYLTAIGEFYLMKGERKQAEKYFTEALSRTHSNSEIELLKRKVEMCK